MVASSLINRRDIMNLLLLGLYLCLCVAINPAESSDWETGFTDFSEIYWDLQNCTRCDAEQADSCSCKDYFDKCVICCSDTCCVCPDCDLCWEDQRKLILVTQISISILFGFGVIGLIIVYCKICHSARLQTQAEHRRRIVLQEARDLTTQCSTVESIRDRPPSYNEVVRNGPPVYTSSCNSAPPLYTSPHNRTSMQEAPPSYPGTPKPQEKIQDAIEPPVVQHM